MLCACFVTHFISTIVAEIEVMRLFVRRRYYKTGKGIEPVGIVDLSWPERGLFLFLTALTFASTIIIGVIVLNKMRNESTNAPPIIGYIIALAIVCIVSYGGLVAWSMRKSTDKFNMSEYNHWVMLTLLIAEIVALTVAVAELAEHFIK